MSISAVEKSSSSAMPARCPVIRRPSPRAGIAAVVKPIRSRSPRTSRSTFQSRSAAGSSPLRRREASVGSGDVDSENDSTESMNQPGVMRAVRSKHSPRCTRTSHAARPTTTPGERSIVVTRTTSRSTVRGSNESRTVTPAACSSTYNRDGWIPGAAPCRSLPARAAVTPATDAGSRAAGRGHRTVTSAGTTRPCSSSMADTESDGAVWIAMPPPDHDSTGSRSSGSVTPLSGTGATAVITRGSRPPTDRRGSSIRSSVPSSDAVQARSSIASR